MLTLVKSDDAVPIVGIYSGKNKNPTDTVYFTHNLDKENQNVAGAAGVLQLHRAELKREFHMNDEDFKEVCRMIDAEEEPERLAEARVLADPGAGRKLFAARDVDRGRQGLAL